MTTLPIRKALVKAHLTPAHLVREMNSGLKEPLEQFTVLLGINM